MIWVLLVVGLVVAGVVVKMAVSKRQPDGVDSFRRQIDALSPDARRSIVGRVNEAAGRDAEPAGTHRRTGDDGDQAASEDAAETRADAGGATDAGDGSGDGASDGAGDGDGAGGGDGGGGDD